MVVNGSQSIVLQIAGGVAQQQGHDPAQMLRILALLAALRDTGKVQQDALAAAERFRLAEGDIVPALAAALQDESAATAYAAAQMLAALGRSAETPQRRAEIVAALADALRDPRSRRGVYVLDAEQKIQYLGRLDEALYRGLVQVTGASTGAAGPQ